MKILAIETTCDETGLAVLEFQNDKFRIMANELASQVKIHKKYGGVVPILAAREHEKNLPYLFNKIIKIISPRKIDYLAFAIGPGLEPALIRGRDFTIKLAREYSLKIVTVNHLAGHFYSFLAKNELKKWQKIKNINFPALGLIVSGGHTILYLFKDYYRKIKLGETRDDAAGEAFDKVARMLDLSYPGGPQIERLSKQGKAIYFLPRPMLENKFEFSFAGLKTAVLELIKELKSFNKFDETSKKNIAASFQKTVFEILIYKLAKAKKIFSAKSIVIGGGVAANRTLKREIKNYFNDIDIYFPEKTLATDNGVNIALAAYFKLKEVKTAVLEKINELEVYPRLKW